MHEPYMEQTAIGLNTTRGFTNDLMVIPRERSILRSLAQKVAELAAVRKDAGVRERWTAHNDLRTTSPLIFCDPENGWSEIIPQRHLQCETPLLRIWEMTLKKEIFWGTIMGDDRPIEPYFNVPYNYIDTGWGLMESMRGHRDDSWAPPLKDYDRDMSRLRHPGIEIDTKATERVIDLATDIVGDFLTVRLRGVWWWTLGMTRDAAALRGREQFIEDMSERPGDVHRLMSFLSGGITAKLDFLEGNGLLALNNDGTYVGSGGFGWTEALPAEDHDPERIRTLDMWGFAESQETAGIAPELFEEFVYPYQAPILDRFGLNCYGCCEPLNERWEVVKKFPRLRRVSVSPGADVNAMAEALGGDYIFSWKPNPSQLASGTLDEDAVRATVSATVEACRANGCHLEMIMKDTHSLGGNPHVLPQWCRIAREVIAG